MNDPQPNPTTKNTKRKIKEFPKELASVTDRPSYCHNNDNNDTNNNNNNNDSETILFDLKTLVIDHLRRFCKNVGVLNCGSLNKFDCRKALAKFLKIKDPQHHYHHHQEDNTLDDEMRLSARRVAATARLTSTILRAVNVVFSDKFRNDFLRCVMINNKDNGRKRTRDHDDVRRNTNRNFWHRAAMAHNMVVAKNSSPDIVNASPTRRQAIDLGQQQEEDKLDGCDANNSTTEFTQLLHCEGDPHLSHLLPDGSLNLLQVDQLETFEFRKKILDLVKIRRCIKQYMKVSAAAGTVRDTNNDAWNFIESAMAKTPGVFTKVGVYYFYKQCEQVEGIDCNHQPLLDGDTLWLHSSDSENDNDDEEDTSSAKAASASVAASTTCNSGTKKRKDNASTQEKEDETSAGMKILLEQGKLTLRHMNEAATRERLRFELETKIRGGCKSGKTSFRT
ncbi:hypothetical protein MHU86_24083 [Fragilaria crotonensis]|nr:hypothetical protein MHU86_24083 [Fragilaria crotonensis]